MKRLLAIFALLPGLLSAATLSPVQLLNPVGSTAGQAIVSTGASTPPAWGAVSSGSLAPIAANTVLGNFTGSSAAPAAFAVASCSTANSALKYTSGTGLSCGTTFALTSGNLSQFAATTSAQLLGVLSDETGSGLAVFGTSPSLTTPTIAGATLSGTFAGAHTYSGAVTLTSTITPSATAGIVGTTTNDNANAGSVGEFVSSTVLVGSAVSLTSGATANVTSISLTAGDWQVCGNVVTNPAAGTTQSSLIGAISTTSAAIPTSPNGGATVVLPFAAPAGQAISAPVGCQRQSLSATTTVYLVITSSFAVSTNGGYGFIGARRVR